MRIKPVQIDVLSDLCRLGRTMVQEDLINMVQKFHYSGFFRRILTTFCICSHHKEIKMLRTLCPWTYVTQFIILVSTAFNIYSHHKEIKT